jgi:RRXRR protein
LSVFVLDQRKRPLMPCCEKRARLLLERGRAVVDRRYRFTRWALYEALADTGLPAEAACGGRTKFNRSRLGILKTYALCVGEVRARVGWQQPTRAIKASGRGDDLTKLAAHGLPRGSCMRTKSVRGFQTGDMVRAEVPTGNKAGTQVGRAAVRGGGCFRVRHADGINARYCKLLPCADGDCHAGPPALPPRPQERGFQRGRP